LRLFVAAYPPPEAIDDLAALVSELAIGQPRAAGESLRLVPPERWHQTLAFLGEVADERLPDVHAALAAAASRWPDQRPAPSVALCGGGRFGKGRFTTVWTGVRGDTAALGDVVTDIRQQLRRARLPFDAKAYRPHVTLARPADRLPEQELAADLDRLGRHRGPQWTVEAIELVRSTLGPQITYERLAGWPLVTATRPTPQDRGRPFRPGGRSRRAA
jgi:RNA 2',3'-cyclic 3'-phosphodiesterase